MKVVLTSNPPADIPVKELPPGIPAIITKWGNAEKYVGNIVQRVATALFSFGSATDYWTDFELDQAIDETCRVRPLKVSETLAIVE